MEEAFTSGLGWSRCACELAAPSQPATTSTRRWDRSLDTKERDAVALVRLTLGHPRGASDENARLGWARSERLRAPFAARPEAKLFRARSSILAMAAGVAGTSSPRSAAVWTHRFFCALSSGRFRRSAG